MTHDPDQPQHNDEAQTMSLLHGVARAEGLPDADDLELEASGGLRQVNQTTLVMVGIAAIAAATLWFMRPNPTDAASDDNQQAAAKVEQVLVELSNPQAMNRDSAVAPGNLQALFADTDAVISMLSADYTDHQVPVRFVKKNPFRLKEEEQAAVGQPTGPSPEEIERERRLKSLQNEFARLQLQSVMGGATPIAMIDGEMYRQGDAVGDFTVKSISSDKLEVVLEAMGETFRLQMQSAQGSR